MSRIGTGILTIGSAADQITLDPLETATVTHNAGVVSQLTQMINDLGETKNSGILPYLDIVTNSTTQIQFFNNGAGGTFSFHAIAWFEIFSPQHSGEIPSSQVVVTP